jgi:GNAT superfamily N-acetyltransferase
MAAILQIEPLIGGLPPDLVTMREEARAENHRFLERLVSDWASGSTMFDGDGEALLAAWLDDVMAGIGGITLDPVVSGALRMRRFYVRSIFRGRGIGRALVGSLLEQPRRAGQVVFVNEGEGSGAFWEALGFVVDRRDGHTHVLLNSRD